jgi:uncharacterized membrane protein YeaQ/YmgE (transglycosylase-associated protein family)
LLLPLSCDRLLHCAMSNASGREPTPHAANFPLREGAIFGGALMTLETMLIWALVGIVAGFLAGVVVRGYGLGLLGNLVVGLIGAMIGGWLLPRLGIGAVTGMEIVDTILVATIGAIVLLLIIGLFRRPVA